MSSASRIRRRTTLAALTAAMLVTGLSTPVPAAPNLPELPGSGGSGGEEAAPPIDESFYDTTTVTAGAPGTILRTALANTAPMPAELDYPLPSSVTKVLYSTTDMHGNPIPVSGYLVEPSVAWTGAGERPTVVIGRGTVGQGDKCAPSRNWPVDDQADPFSSGRLVNLEGVYDWVFASAGVRVFVTDYVGMGTPGMHTYMNRAEQAHAMLDGARAAHALAATRGAAPGKVAFYGHSQGGGASAAAVETASAYAPELDVAAAYASAPPADLDAVQRGIDGSDLVGAIGFTINGLTARYPELESILAENLNETGIETMADLAGMCTNEITETYGHQTTSQWTRSGRSLDETLQGLPAGQRAMNDQFIGNGFPAAPTMVVSGRHDLNVDYGQARQLANNWCANGGQVFYQDDVLPRIEGYNHFAQAVSGAPFGVGFILAMFNGAAAHGACINGVEAPAATVPGSDFISIDVPDTGSAQLNRF